MARNDNHREIAELTSVSESRALRNLLSKRKEFLQDQVNSCVRSEKFMEAFGELAKLDDCNKLIDMILLRINTLNKENENG